MSIILFTWLSLSATDRCTTADIFFVVPLYLSLYDIYKASQWLSSKPPSVHASRNTMDLFSPRFPTDHPKPISVGLQKMPPTCRVLIKRPLRQNITSVAITDSIPVHSTKAEPQETLPTESPLFLGPTPTWTFSSTWHLTRAFYWLIDRVKNKSVPQQIL